MKIPPSWAVTTKNKKKLQTSLEYASAFFRFDINVTFRLSLFFLLLVVIDRNIHWLKKSIPLHSAPENELWEIQTSTLLYGSRNALFEVTILLGKLIKSSTRKNNIYTDFECLYTKKDMQKYWIYIIENASRHENRSISIECLLFFS
jgi:hypothetical protein